MNPMRVAIFCEDLPGEEAVRLRQERLADHLAHVEAVLDQILVAGPMKDGEGRICGSLLVLDVPSLDAAAQLMARDPYHVPGIWASVRYLEFQAVAGAWVGGAAWKSGPS
jgi:uncharacterized protein YciI